MNSVQIEDCKNIGKLSFIHWEKLRNTTILITGATGLIGSNLVNALAYNSKIKGLDLRIILPVRNLSLARRLFNWTDVEFIPYSFESNLDLREDIDFIVHLASPTSSKWFIERPVETILANVEGTNHLLLSAIRLPIQKFVFLSSMEVYGFPQKGHKVKENEIGSFDTMTTRNSYPIAKIASEALCNSYWSEFKVPVVILRATQTFGPGVKYNDGRVFAEFMRCAVEKKDIVLKSEGLTERPYLYTADAISAIIVALISGEAGNCYTVANPNTYCSIKDMACLVAEQIADDQIKVRSDIKEDLSGIGYANTLYMDLDVDRIEKLNWYPTTNLREMFIRMIRGLGTDI